MRSPRCAQGLDVPAAVLPVRDQGADAHDRVVDVLGKIFAHRGTDFVIGFADVPVGGGKALEIRRSFEVPNDDVAYGLS
jgi:hypothetical protein